MATRKKSIKVPVNFGDGAVADNVLTTLGTPTIYIPENSAGNPITFSSAMLFVAQQSTGSTGQTITSPSVTVTLSGASATTVTVSGTSGQSGEDNSGIIGPIDVLSHFTANYGTVTSKTCQVQTTMNVSAGTSIGVYAWFELTYTYDDSATTRIQTICVPYESSTTTLPTTATTYATLKNLTGAGGILSGYANRTIRHRWIEIKGNTNVGTSTTDIRLSYNFDGGTTQLLPFKENGGGFGNWVYYQVDSSGVTSTATHTFQLWNSLASRWANIIVNEWISFEYTVAGTNSCLNYIELPIEYTYPMPNTANSASVFYRNLNLPEPNISLVKGAVEVQYNSAASVTMQIRARNQTAFRGYAQSSDAVAGQFTFNHGVDADSASGTGFSLSQGDNPIYIYLYDSTGTPANVSGHIKLLYSSSIAPTGIDSHTHTFYSFSRQINFNTTTEANVQDSIQLAEPNYWLTETAMQYYLFTQASNSSLLVRANLLPNEGSGTGSRELYLDTYLADGEWSFGGWTVRNRPEFKRYPNDPDDNRMNIESSRIYKTSMTTAGAFGYRFFTTYHTVTGSISGNITNSGGGTVNIDLYQLSASVPTFYDRTTRSGDGSYSFVVYDRQKEYYVTAYTSDTLKGMSKQATQGSGFDIDLSTGGGGGGGEYYF